MIELLVVTVILGVTAALVFPMIRRGPSESASTAGPMATARSLAATRGGDVEVSVRDDGSWRVDAPATATTDATREQTLATGLGAQATLTGRWTVTPAGLCLPQSVRGLRAWDPARCASIESETP